MSYKLVVGQEPWLSLALDAWSDLDTSIELIRIELTLREDYSYDVDALNPYQPADDGTAFVAWGPTFLNFQRLEMMGHLKGRGFKMPALVSRHAVMSAQSRVSENVWVAHGAVIGPHALLGMNTYVGVGSHIGASTKVGNSTWVGDHVIVGHQVQLGSHAVLSTGVVVADGVTIGRQVTMERPMRVDHDVPDRAFFLKRSELNGVIVDGGGDYTGSNPTSHVL